MATKERMGSASGCNGKRGHVTLLKDNLFG